MKSIEVRAKTEEVTIAIVLPELGLSLSEVEVILVRGGETGILGFGSEEVRVRVMPLRQRAPYS
jgi:predicted RNA-binding protein Jag